MSDQGSARFEIDDLTMVCSELITDNEISGEHLSDTSYSFNFKLKILRARF